MRRIALTTAALLAASAASGCHTTSPSTLSASNQNPTSSAVADPESTFSYAAGRAIQTFPQSTATLQPIVLSALEDLRIHSVTLTREVGAVVFKGTTASAARASVTLRPTPDGSRLSARIGLFGDEPLSRALMDRVGIRLGSLPPSAIPAEPPSEPDKNPYFSRDAVPDSEMLKDQAEAPYRSGVTSH